MKFEYIDINEKGVLVDESDKITDGLVLLPNGKIKTAVKESGTYGFITADEVAFLYFPKGSKQILFAEKELNLEVSVLPNWREFDVNKLALSEYPCRTSPGWEDHWSATERKCFIAGHNHTKKLYTDEDLRKIFAYALENVPSHESHTKMISDVSYRHFVMDELYVKAKESIKKFPKYIVIESDNKHHFEPDKSKRTNIKNGVYYLPKLIINSENKQEVVINEIIWN